MLKRQSELHGLSRNYSLKAHIERIFGHKQFLTVKDFPRIQTWEKNIEKLFKTYKKVINDSIKVQPDIFTSQINEYYDKVNKALLTKYSTEEELFSHIIALQSELIFLLIGDIGYVQNDKGRSLSGDWDLSFYRETQIVQTKENISNYIKKIVNKKFSRIQMDQFAEEKRLENNKEDFFLWIFKKKMNSKFE